MNYSVYATPKTLGESPTSLSLMSRPPLRPSRDGPHLRDTAKAEHRTHRARQFPLHIIRHASSARGLGHCDACCLEPS